MTKNNSIKNHLQSVEPSNNTLDSTKNSRNKAITKFAEDFIFNYFTTLDAWELHGIVQRLRKDDIGRYFAITDLFINQGFKTIPLEKVEFLKSEDFLDYLLTPQNNKPKSKNGKNSFNKHKSIKNIWLKHMTKFYPKDAINKNLMEKILLHPVRTQLDLKTQKLFGHILRLYISLCESEILDNKSELRIEETSNNEFFDEIISCVNEIGFVPRIWTKEGIRKAIEADAPNIDIIALNIDTCELYPLTISKFENSVGKLELRLHNAYDIVPFIDISEEFSNFKHSFSLKDYKKLFVKINDLIRMNYAPKKQYCSICNPINSFDRMSICQYCDTIIEYIAVNTPTVKRSSIERRIRDILLKYKDSVLDELALQNLINKSPENLYYLRVSRKVYEYLNGKLEKIVNVDEDKKSIRKKDIERLFYFSFRDLLE